MSIYQSIKEAVDTNCLAPEEGLYLAKLARAAQNDLAGLNKEAGFAGPGGTGLQNAASLALIAGALLPAGIRATKWAMDPFVEQARYQRAMALPGSPIDVPDRALDAFYIDRSLPLEEQHELARRKAFSILHKFGPETTRVPEIARQQLQEQVMHSPLTAMEAGTSRSEMAIRPLAARADVLKRQQGEFTSAATAFKSYADMDATNNPQAPMPLDGNTLQAEARNGYMREMAEQQGRQQAQQFMVGQGQLMNYGGPNP